MTWTDQSAHHMYMPRPSTGRPLPAGNLLAQASIKGALARICCCPISIVFFVREVWPFPDKGTLINNLYMYALLNSLIPRQAAHDAGASAVAN